MQFSASFLFTCFQNVKYDFCLVGIVDQSAEFLFSGAVRVYRHFFTGVIGTGPAAVRAGVENLDDGFVGAFAFVSL